MVETGRNGNGHVQVTDLDYVPDVSYGTSDRHDLGLRVPGALKFDKLPNGKVTVVTGPMRSGDMMFVG